MCALHHDSTEKVLVFYHADCHDGHVAAFTLWRDLRDNKEVEVEYYPMEYGDNSPDVTGKIVYILDFSFSYEVITRMIKQAKALLIFDHHETSQEALAEIDDKFKIFDMDECASTLIWKYLHPDDHVPLLYRYIRSRDLWRYDVKDTCAFHLAFELAIRNEEGKYDFELTEKYLKEKEIENLLSAGKVLEAYYNILIENTLNKVYFCPIRRENRLLIVAYVNALHSLASDIGHQCMKKYPFVDFCVCYDIDSANQETHFSLRSKGEYQDVSIIAKEHGGGGHRNAAGCKLPEVTCRLKYEHLNPWPLWCMYAGKKLKISQESLNDVLTPEYLQLLRLRFPGKTLQIDLDFAK